MNWYYKMIILSMHSLKRVRRYDTISKYQWTIMVLKVFEIIIIVIIKILLINDAEK